MRSKNIFNRKSLANLATLFLAFFFFYSCSTDELVQKEPEPDEIGEPKPEPEPEPEKEYPSAGTTLFVNPEKVDDNYILVNDAGNNRVFLMNKMADILHEWSLEKGIGNDVQLLPNGELLAVLQSDDADITFGGQGGIIQFVDKDDNVLWNFEYASEDHIIHHDAELLPNGNILTIVWERKTSEEARIAGYKLEVDVFPEAIIEIDKTTKEIVWEWHAWDHLIQDFDETKENYGLVAENPRLINLNYVDIDDGDIMHANGIAYDADKDVIYLSVNFFSEVWVIDHSTTTDQAANILGGRYGHGGNLLYRFGNPEAHGSTEPPLFQNNHFPNLLNNTGDNKMLIYSNGRDVEQSTVFELSLPTDFLSNTIDQYPEIVWSFTSPDLFAPKVSGAVLLPNGNRLITEGDYGMWEVTTSGEVVWKFQGDGFYWRGYHYAKDAPEIIGLQLDLD